MTYKIKHKETSEIIHEVDVKDGCGLRKANLSDTDLSSANLRGVNLSGSDLSRVDLSDADLRGSDLSGVNLRYTDLRGANLRYTDLYKADLTFADLSGANLYKANLSRADLSGADLYKANLSDANLYKVELSGAQNITSFGPVGKSRRIGYAVKYDNYIMIQLGCFWDTSDEAIKQVSEKYGEDSGYVLMIKGACKCLEEQE